MKSKDEWRVGDIMVCPDSGTRARRGLEAGMLYCITEFNAGLSYCITEFNAGFPQDKVVIQNVVTVDADGNGEWWRPSDLEYVCGGGVEELKRLIEL